MGEGGVNCVKGKVTFVGMKRDKIGINSDTGVCVWSGVSLRAIS